MLHPDAPHRTIEQREAAIDITTASQLLIGMFRYEGFSMLPDVPSVAPKMDKLVEGYHVYPERQMPRPILTNVLTPDSPVLYPHNVGRLPYLITVTVPDHVTAAYPDSRSMALAINDWEVRPFSYIKNQPARQPGEFDPLVDWKPVRGLLHTPEAHRLSATTKIQLWSLKDDRVYSQLFAYTHRGDSTIGLLESLQS